MGCWIILGVSKAHVPYAGLNIEREVGLACGPRRAPRGQGPAANPGPVSRSVRKQKRHIAAGLVSAVAPIRCMYAVQIMA